MRIHPITLALALFATGAVAQLPAIDSTTLATPPASIDTAASSSPRDSAGVTQAVAADSGAIQGRPSETVARAPHEVLPTVAILSFTGTGFEEKDLAAATSRFETEILASDSFRVVERRHMDRILKEQGFQQSGACDISECQVQVGELLGVRYLFTGELSQTGRILTLTVKRADVGTGQTVFSHALDIKGNMGDLLRGGVPEMARIATRQKKPDRDHTVLVADKLIWPWIAGGTVVVAGGIAMAVLLSDDTTTDAAPATASVVETTDLKLTWH